MESKSATYERLKRDIGLLEAAADHLHRDLHWVENAPLAVARNQDSCIEVFLAGGPLRASIRIVEDLLEHQVWAYSGGEFAAARIVLPFGEHFDRLAAVLCVDLIDNDLAHERQEAFSAVEPMLGLALQRNTVGDPVLNGLIGELELLRRLLLGASPASRPDVLQAWAGSVPSARDFQLNTVGVEVKVTQGRVSAHHVSGVHQIELGSGNGGVAETNIFLLSLGIEWLSRGVGGTSLPDLVNSLLALTPTAARADLLAQIKQYGGDISIGYDHDRDQWKGRYSGRYFVRFERLYDMTDDRLELLSSSDLVGLRNIDPSSVEFKVVLQDQVRGDLNPVKGWDALVPRLLETAGIQN
ncbi:Putative PD-(D/E)XK family member [Pedococcus cremeus]|uniref:Putative PD-(D/E)XK family member n=1 Tax=Pedococcus cremeus TaxID=587636 RepID=A0A1H9QL07_9MICO|nr:PD-(D/E)XK motif protein [Pedococcus cremeus]SER61100.1 Putative PD-(D/E)XK family member [Pedococcus cremeus]